jgi:epsilon-lactone hydrolase
MAAKKFNRRLKVRTGKVDGFAVHTITAERVLNKHILYLHGGAYLFEAVPPHRAMIELLCMGYGFKVSFIDYPLAPENQFGKTHEVLHAAYEVIVTENPEDEFYLFGDSAGGGLALAFLQELVAQSIHPMISKTALLSPWLDIGMQNPEIESIAAKDPILYKPALLQAARSYAGDADLEHPKLSPLYGNMDHLGDILLLSGTHEICYPDCLRLHEKLEEAVGNDVDFRVYEKMMHDWIMLPIPEARRAIHEIAAWYLREK